MPDAFLAPYLSFNGNCKEAMEFYHSVIGGELDMNTFGSMNMPGTPDDYKEKIMHSMISSDAITLMASDTAPGTAGYSVGNGVSLSLAGTNGERLKKLWDGLSEGGEITMPMDKQPWGDEFGMFNDKFGMSWMINITTPTQ